MKTIYKYGPVSAFYECVVHGRIVHIDMQGAEVFVWAEQGENIPPSKVKIVGTGNGYDGEYVGTIIQRVHNMDFVWHVIRQC